MRKLALVALALLLSPAPERKPFTIEQVLGAAFPSDLVAAPAGGRVAWVLNMNGARNVWVAEPPDYRGRRLTSYAGDEGVDLAQVAWTPEARAVVYTRGGDLETGRDAPNPTNAVEPAKQGVWIAPLDGAAPQKLGDGNSPAVAPAGGRVAFLSNNEVWWAKTDGAEKAERLFGAKGGISTLRWSPDGARLAFACGRGDHGYVGVYDVAAKTVRYLDPSVDNDVEPVWSPDGARLAFIRVPTRSTEMIFAPAREAQPWSIRVVDVATSAARELWRADEGRGSAYREVVADAQLLWTADGRIVFPWEKDGWTHLYSIPVSGGRATLLTPGAFEVEHVAPAANGKELLFSSNQGDADRRHLWRVAASGGTPSAVTSGAGIEWAPVATADGRAVAFLCSDARRPAHACVLVGKEKRELAPEAIPADFPSDALVEPQPVLLTATDGMTIHAQLFLPPDAARGRHPALAFFHGGSRRQMLLGWHYMDYYHNAYAMNQYLASRGYVVLAVNYRSGIGYGMEFREALGYGAAGASEFADVAGAGLYLKGRPDVDPARIGLWGGSYGGYLTALGLARASDLFAAGVDFHGVHDWNTEIPNFVPSYNPLERPEEARLAFASSPMSSLDTWRSPVLVVHGDDDRNVPFGETARLVEGLRKRHVEVEQLVLPGEIHDFLRYESWVRVYGATADFFDRRLRAAR